MPHSFLFIQTKSSPFLTRASLLASARGKVIHFLFNVEVRLRSDFIVMVNDLQTYDHILIACILWVRP